MKLKLSVHKLLLPRGCNYLCIPVFPLKHLPFRREIQLPTPTPTSPSLCGKRYKAIKNPQACPENCVTNVRKKTQEALGLYFQEISAKMVLQ